MWKFIPVLIVTFFFHGGNFAYADSISFFNNPVGTVDFIEVEAQITNADLVNGCSTGLWKLVLSGIGGNYRIESNLRAVDSNPAIFHFSDNINQEYNQIFYGCSDATTALGFPELENLYVFEPTFFMSGNFVENPYVNEDPYNPTTATSTVNAYAEDRDKMLIFFFLFSTFIMSLFTTIIIFKPFIYDRK